MFKKISSSKVSKNSVIDAITWDNEPDSGPGLDLETYINMRKCTLCDMDTVQYQNACNSCKKRICIKCVAKRKIWIYPGDVINNDDIMCPICDNYLVGDAWIITPNFDLEFDPYQKYGRCKRCKVIKIVNTDLLFESPNNKISQWHCEQCMPSVCSICRHTSYNMGYGCDQCDVPICDWCKKTQIKNNTPKPGEFFGKNAFKCLGCKKLYSRKEIRKKYPSGWRSGTRKIPKNFNRTEPRIKCKRCKLNKLYEPYSDEESEEEDSLCCRKCSDRTCNICYKKLCGEKVSGCGECDTPVCIKCKKRHYNTNVHGSIFNARATRCPMCISETTDLSLYNKYLHRTIKKSKVLEDDVHYIWCKRCTKIAFYAEHDCAMELGDIHDELCYECNNDLKKCPNCGFDTFKTGGCDHMRCVSEDCNNAIENRIKYNPDVHITTHWCWNCNYLTIGTNADWKHNSFCHHNNQNDRGENNFAAEFYQARPAQMYNQFLLNNNNIPLGNLLLDNQLRFVGIP